MIDKMSDERKASLAVFLSIIIILVWTNLFMPPPPAPEKDTTAETVDVQPSEPVRGLNAPQLETAAVVHTPAVTQPDLATDQVIAKSTQPTVDDYFSSQKIKIETPKVSVQLSTLGGRLLNYKLKDYLSKVDTDILVDMVRPEGNSFPLGVEIGTFNDAAVSYRLVGVSNGTSLAGSVYTLASGQNASFNLEGVLPDGRTISKVVSIEADSYLFDVSVKLSAATQDGSKIKINWIEDLPADFKENRYNIKSFIYLEQDKSLTREYVNDNAQVYPEQFVKWVGLGDNYFTANIFSPGPFTPVNFESKYVDEIHRLTMQATGDTQSGEFKIYAGPKVPAVLKEVGFDLHRNIDLGWFSFIGQPLLAFIQFWFRLLGNYGLAIIIVTILIKLCLLPLTKKSYVSMKAMQELQPKVAAIREKFKDPKQVQQEMMKIYQQNGVNPMGGCLPMVLQIPVFLGMYNALQSSIYLRHADFALWINDLSAPEKLMLFGIPIPVMILLMGISMFGQTMLTPTTADPQQKKIMYIMPIMFTGMFIIYPFPSGLVLYWLVNNIMSIIQQYSIRTERNIQPLQATIVAGIVVFAIGYVVTLL